MRLCIGRSSCDFQADVLEGASAAFFYRLSAYIDFKLTNPPFVRIPEFN